MSRTFDEDPRFRVPVPEPAAEPPGQAGRQLRPGLGGVSVSGAVRAWQQQLARLERLQEQLADLEALERAHREARARELHPLQQRRRALVASLVQGLAQRLDDKTLSVRQRETARERLCSLAAQLADEGDAAMRELHDRFSPQSWQNRRREAAHALRLRLEEQLGAALDIDDGPLSPEAVWRAGLARLHQARDARREQRRERSKARQARRSVPATQTEGQALTVQADQTLRQLYRQLASALHPDRESDPGERQRKTALMGEANAAYERRDLLTLLRLQGQQVVQGDDAGPQAEQRLQAMTLLLRRQVADRERERAARQTELAWAFDLPAGEAAREQSLRAQLQTQVRQALTDVEALQQDLVRLDDPAALRRWLNSPWP